LADKPINQSKGYRLPDIHSILQIGVTYLLLVVLFTLILMGLVIGLRSFIDTDNLFTWLLCALLIVLLFNPLRASIQKGVDKFIFRKPFALDELLRGYNQELLNAVDIDQLAAILFKYVNLAVEDTTPGLYFSDETQGGYCSYQNNNEFMIETNSPIIGYFRETPGAIDLTEEKSWPTKLKQHQDELAGLNAAVIIPMSNGQELLGWITLSNRSSNQRFNSAQLDYFAALTNQSMIGLERANVIRRLEARVSELDVLSQFSQYISFTIVFDDLLELVYTNYQRLIDTDNFSVYWKDPESGRIFTAFYVEKDERISEKEGFDEVVEDQHILEVIRTGQMMISQDENDHTFIILPLNAGADTLGALHTICKQPNFKLSQRQERLLSVFADRTAIALDRLQTRQQLEIRARQMEIINEVTFSLASTLELEPLLNLILDKAMELLDTEAGTFMLTVEDTGELEFRVVRGPTSHDLIGTRLPIGTGLAGTAAQTGRPILVNKVQEDKRWFNQVDAASDFQTQSILTAPLLRQSAVLGVVQVINKRNGAPFNEEEQTLLTAFAGQAVVALENARLVEQTDKALQDRVNELFLLQQLDRDLNTTLELDQVLNLALDWIIRICRGTGGSIALANNDGKLHLAAVRGQDESFDITSIDGDDLDGDLIKRVYESGEPLNTPNIHQEDKFFRISDSIHSQITLPIIHKQRHIGVISIGSDQFDAFDQEMLESAVRATNHAAGAIANANLYEQVNEANLAKSEFVSMVSHELKTPMTSMRGYTDLMLSGMTGELSQQQKNFLETIAANIRRMSKQIQDLTDISRIETGRLRMEKAPIAFSNIVSETLQSVQGPCDSKNIELHLDLPSDLPLILADKERLVQVLTNLISNACKYSPPKTKVDIILKSEPIALKEGHTPIPMIVCSVKDNGYGISEDDQKKLFTKFFRAEDPNIRKATGTGLGLSITKGIIEMHGGKIWVESELGSGTTFYFAIPQIH